MIAQAKLLQAMRVLEDIILTKQEAFLFFRRGGCHEERLSVLQKILSLISGYEWN